MYKFLLEQFSVLWGIYLGVDLLNHLVILCLTFSGTIKMFSTVAVQFIFLPAMYEGSNISIFSPTLVYFLVFFFVFFFSHPSGCEVIPHCGFGLRCSND